MFALGIRYLNGFSAAASPNDRESAEWPPHPGRVFMALAAAHFATGADPGERAALEWLEAVEEAPSLYAPNATERQLVSQYVPVNDKAGPATALMRDLPLTRDRQPRSFARRCLESDTVYVAWPSAEPTEAVRHALAALCAKVTRVGHSSSLVQVWAATEGEVPRPNWVPESERAEMHLRVASLGTLQELERCYNQGTGTPLRPQLSVYQGYARSAAEEGPAASVSVFSPHLVVLTLQPEETVYASLGLRCVLAVTQRWREAIVSKTDGLPDRIRQLVAGHNSDGTVFRGAHLALMPLAFVGHEHADGRLLGMALALPSQTTAVERREALRAVARVRHLALGPLGRWRLAPETSSSPPWNLRASTWTAYPWGARRWATVTPISLDTHPKATKRSAWTEEAAEIICVACGRVGLPAPCEVMVTTVSAHVGAPPAFAFPRLARKDGSERQHTHAILVFDKPVCGPVILGAGRYRGYGLARALH